MQCVTFPQIPGLYLYSESIDEEAECRLVRELDSQTWDNILKRRTQMYGYMHDYFSNKKLTAATAKGTKPLPEGIDQLGKWLSSMCGLEFNTVIVNEYVDSQGVTKHTDKVHFEDTIACVSLLEGCDMIFRKGDDVVIVWLPRRSLLVMKGEARWDWKHEIPCNKTLHDPVNGLRKRHDTWRRVSVTYRRLE